MLDVNIPIRIFHFLEKEGYNSFLVKDINPNFSDKKILSYADENEMVIITSNKDFSLLGQHHPHFGIILLRARSQKVFQKISALKELFFHLSDDKIIGKILFVECN